MLRRMFLAVRVIWRALVVVGGDDLLQDRQRSYAQWLTKCGKQVELVEYPNAFHSFYAFQELPEFQFLIRDVRAFVSTPH